MLKTSYILAWTLVALAAIVSMSGSCFTSVTQGVFSVAVLALVYALALWFVITDGQEAGREIFCRNDELGSKGGRQ